MPLEAGLARLNHEQCMDLLGRSSFGRVGVSVDALPAILPVTIAVIDDAVVFRTVPGTKLAYAARNAVLAVEIDDYDPVGGEGWSVLVRGVATQLEDADEIARARAAARAVLDPRNGRGALRARELRPGHRTCAPARRRSRADLDGREGAMKVLVAYGSTRQGTAGIAETLAAELRERSVETDLAPGVDDRSGLLLDDLAPTSDASIAAHLIVDAPRSETFGAAKSLDLLKVHTPLLTASFWARSLPERVLGRPAPAPVGPLTLVGELGIPGWMKLGEDPGHEIAFGAIGVFWEPVIRWNLDVVPEKFAGFAEPGWGKIACSYSVVDYGRRSLLTYECRTTITDDDSRRSLPSVLVARATVRLAHHACHRPDDRERRRPVRRLTMPADIVGVGEASGMRAPGRRRHHGRRRLLRGHGYFKRLGPGFVTGAADDDPSGIGTYSQVGAAFGLGLVWSTLWLLPIAIAVQEASARLGLVSGQGLAALIRTHTRRSVLFGAVALVVVANTFNLAADLASMGAATRLVIPLPQEVLVVGFTLLMLSLELFLSYHQYARVLRWLAVSLGAYVVVLFMVQVDWGLVLERVLVPSFDLSRTEIAALIALFGTTVSPYLFFWQASEEVEEAHDVHRDPAAAVDRDHLTAMRVDVTGGMVSGIGIMFAIIVAAASTLHRAGIDTVATAEQAARALRPVAGNTAGLVFALGIVGLGLLSVPILAGSTAYALAEAVGWNEGLSERVREARPFYLVIVAAMFIGLGLDLAGLDPIRGLYLAAILNGLVAPPLIAIILYLSRSPKVLPEHRSGLLSTSVLVAAYPHQRRSSGALRDALKERAVAMPGSDITPAIHISGLVKTFGATRALDGLDLEVRVGEVHGFLGPNGSGKTTTIRVLLGLLRADAGEVELLGADPWRDAVPLHRRLAYVPGEVTLWPKLSGGEVIDLLGRLRGDLDRDRRDQLVERFELDPTKKARTYSKGNRQKVGLVAALASRAELLILDEPTSGLDPLMEAVFQDCIREIKAEGRTVLLSSHILAEVEALCDSVSIIRSGRTQEHGTLSQLRQLTRTTIVAETEQPADVIARVAGVHGFRRDDGQVRFDVDTQHLDEVVKQLSTLGVKSLVSHPPTLEELFLRQYGDELERERTFVRSEHDGS